MSQNGGERILLAHGGGGQLSRRLVEGHILPRLANPVLAELGDAARLKIGSSEICFTTDSYVVKPLFFAGGDIGKLAVCGTINDLAVAGAKPMAMSLSLIIETGFEFAMLDKILDSIGKAAKDSGVNIVTGDTKTVEAGSADGIFINTAGVGTKIAAADLGYNRVKAGDAIIVSGTIGDHGMTIMCERQGVTLQTPLASDCAALNGLICPLYEIFSGVKFMRDPTRGGLAATLNEVAQGAKVGIEIYEKTLPVRGEVAAAADMLGFDVLNIANEGKFIAVVQADQAEKFVEKCRQHPLGKDAAIIGKVINGGDMPLVEMVTKIGGRRIVQMPYGRELPRIC